ncbi:hypothetical protein ACFOFO_01850 [Undibacterium arcticum]|uniref:Uncharacterized protein n=1 Tax=Undibacterium arcticum TaxID=1762892 RepID=A0ABV7EVV2_9BURK
MLATKRILILSAVLLTVPPARADKNTGDDPLFLVAPELPHDAQIRFENLGTGWVGPVYRRSRFESSFKREIQDVQGKDVRFAVDPLVGLHWDATGHRPSLAYQFTDNGVMHFRGARHGAWVNAIWSF